MRARVEYPNFRRLAASVGVALASAVGAMSFRSADQTPAPWVVGRVAVKIDATEASVQGAAA